MTIAVLFDLDNTLLDRTATVRAVAAAMAERYTGTFSGTRAGAVEAAIIAADSHGRVPLEEVYSQVSGQFPWPPHGGPAWEDFQDFWHASFPKLARPMPGCAALLGNLRSLGLRLALVTNGGSAAQQAKIDALGVRPLLDAVIISSEAGVEKPDPAIFHLALERLGAPASGSLFVGDHPLNDIEGARRAGLTPVWLPGRDPWPADLPPPPHTIGRLDQVLSLAAPQGAAAPGA